jgi:hypothetical protein
MAKKGATEEFNIEPSGNINATSLHLPRFTISNPRSWFYVAEANFQTKGIKDTFTKASFVIAALPEEAINELWTWLETENSKPKYEALKEELIRLFSPSAPERGKAILELPSIGLGDRNPRQLGQYLDRLALLPDGEQIDLYKEVFLQTMPAAVRCQVRHTSGSRRELYEECQRIFVATRAKSASCTQHVVAASQRSEFECSPIKTADSTGGVDAAQPRHYREKKQWVTTRKMESRQPEMMKLNTRGICSFHERFGRNARSCMDGCKFSKN